MPTKITMPQLGESVSEGTVGQWLKREGELVKKDESLVEIITDKVTAELPSPVSGRLVRILVAEDATVKVGTEIAEIEEGGGQAAPSAPQGASAATPQAQHDEPRGGAPQASVTAAANGQPSAAPSGSASPRATATMERVSPLARRMAQEHSVDLSTIRGTGEGGRVRKEDILAHVQQQATAAPVAPAMAPAPAAPVASAQVEGDQLITPTPARRAIAEHMVRSKRTSPHATTLVEVDMTGVARWLERNKDEFKRREGYGISFQTFVLRAAVEALREFPMLNASWTEEGKILLRKQINIGVSIALENNLVVPVIRNADALSLAGLARAMADVVAKARANRLMPADLQGSTFTVNNPGVFGTLISMAIINQPNAGILTMDSVVKRPVVVDDAIAIRQMMYLSLSFDHRVVDGATAGPFLVAIKRRLEQVTPDAEVS